MRKVILSVMAIAALSVSALGQSGTSTPTGNHSDQIMLKLRQADLMIQITPLDLKKDQINKILATLEKIRDDQKKIRKQEDDILAKLEPEVDKVLKDSIEKGSVPPRSFSGSVSKTTSQMTLTRLYWLTKMVDDLYETCKKTLDAGQMKVMAHSLNVEALDPSKKNKDLSDEDKTKFFIGRILLDDLTYDLLARIAKSK